LLQIVRGLLSPTRVVADLIKSHQPDGGTGFIWSWHWAFFILSISTSLTLYIAPALIVPSWISWILLALYLWLIPFSRCSEILFAFLDDALDQLGGRTARTSFTPIHRLQLAMRSYMEVVLNFATLYFLLPSAWFSKEFRTVVDAIYFSGVTITTVGYGDITPCQPPSQLLTLYEILVGIILVVITFGVYIGKVGRGAA